MTDSADSQVSQDLAIAGRLLQHYSFELNGYTVEGLLAFWTERYPAEWVKSAVLEALYQGRYKVISIEQILSLWQRRGHPSYHVNSEFERLVCSSRSPQADATTPTDAYPDNVVQFPLDKARGGTAPPLPSPLPPTPPSTTNELFPGPSLPPIYGTPSSDPRRDAPTPPRPYFPTPYQPQWDRTSDSPDPIHQFTPAQTDSEFYGKLKAVAHPPTETPSPPTEPYPLDAARADTHPPQTGS